jgi:hypothetical protein
MLVQIISDAIPSGFRSSGLRKYSEVPFNQPKEPINSHLRVCASFDQAGLKVCRVARWER